MNLSTAKMLAAFDLLGKQLSGSHQMTILIIGGAAGLLTGQLNNRTTTEDIDVIAYIPPESARLIEDDMIRSIGRQLDLNPGWFEDSQVRLKASFLPLDWQARAKQVGLFGVLRVLAIGRQDLIAMKIAAARPKDRQDVLSMDPSREELDWVEAYLQRLAGHEDITKATEFLKQLRGNCK
jgi:predicted nucleotidyltransferase